MSVRADQEINEIPILINQRPNSSYVFNDLISLNDSKRSYLSPLAVVALIDMNAFFAQVEQIRLDLTIDDPVVCVQWSSLIAVSYAARKFGISRMDSVKTAKSKCPNVILAHAAVFKKGESNWSYLNHIPSQGNYKVSLDPYRRESRKIIRLFHQHCDLVEKASVDECYLDFGRSIYERLLNLFPFLNKEDKNEKMPPIPSSLPDSLQWKGEVANSEQERNPEIKDWDDICMLIGSQILFELRVEVYKELGYTTSGGLARNKILAKVAGGFKKPDNQTIIRTSSIESFLQNFTLTDFTGMGGKIGEVILNSFNVPQNTNSISYIRNNFSCNEIIEKLNGNHSLSSRLYNIVRGNVKQELINRMDVKSMMSAKNFTVKFDKLTDAYDWIKVFVGDLYNRLIELDEENLNLSSSQTSDPLIIRPKTLSLHLATTSNVRHSKQVQLHISKSLENLREIMETAGYKLLNDIFDDNTNLEAKHNGRKIRDFKGDELQNVEILPLLYMSLTISNFVRQKDSNLIDSYLNKQNEDILLVDRSKNNSKTDKNSKSIEMDYRKNLFLDFEKESSLQNNYRDNTKIDDQIAIEKRRKDNIEKNKEYISKLFEKYNNELSSQLVTDKHKSKSAVDISVPNTPIPINNPTKKQVSLLDELINSKICPECSISIEDPNEHNDYHVALKLSSSLNGTESVGASRSRKESQIQGKRRKTEKKQRTLPF